MKLSRDKILFWCLITAQAVGSQIIIWTGMPLYTRLRAAAGEIATQKDIAVLLAAVALMQVGHWSALSLRRRLRFRRNVVFGQVLVCIGELSLFFAGAFSTLIMFDSHGELTFSLTRIFVLAAILFAVTAYKYQLSSLGILMIEAQPDVPPQTREPMSENR